MFYTGHNVGGLRTNARDLLRDWRRRWDGQTRAIRERSELIGVLLQEASRRDDNG